MKKRPICAALVILIVVIVLFYPFCRESDSLAEDGKRKTVLCQVEGIAGDGESIVVFDVSSKSKLKVYQKNGRNLFSNLKIGNLISLSGTFYCFEEPGNPGQFNEYEYYKQAGIDAGFFADSLTIQNSNYKKIEQSVHEARTCLIQQFRKCLPEEEAGIIIAMVLGEKSSLTNDIKKLYQQNGIAHILAISGLHISLIGAGIFFFLRRFVLPMKGAAVLTAILLLLYGELTGFSVSATRAIIMMCCILLARFLGRRYDLLNALSLSACIQLILHPISLYQSGFLLSYGTVLGIALFMPVWESSTRKKEKLWIGNMGIHLVTLPILLYFYYEVNCYSALSNLLVLPCLSMLLLLSFSGGILSFFLLAGGKFILGTVHFILCYYHYVCEVLVRLPGAMWVSGKPDLWRILLYYIGLIIWMKIEKRRNYFWILAVCVGVLIIPLPKGKQIWITNLDVGQGDCTCIQTEKRTILVDGGSSSVDQVGTYRIQNYLKYHGISKVDYVFLTHSDSDHINGITELLQEKEMTGIKIETVVLPCLQKKDENYVELENTCKESGVTLKKIKKGDSLALPEGLKISCLHPREEYDWQTENDYSLVLQLEYGSFTGLLTGDLEQEGEKKLTTLPQNIDYLKVSHHGSKGASGEKFLSRIKPEIAVISAGKNNRYGHPAKETINRLEKVGARIYSTIESGAVTVSTDGKEVEVQTFRK